MHLVDLASEEELPDGGDAAPDANIFAVCRFGRLLKGGVDSCGDKVKRGAAFHLERRPGVMGEHVDGRVVGRFGPHQPFQISPDARSGTQGPRTGPNMLRPRIQAPMFSKDSVAKSLSMPVVPGGVLGEAAPVWPCIFLNASVRKNQWWSSRPRTPRGFRRSWRGPAPKPSREMEKAATLTLGMGSSSFPVGNCTREFLGHEYGDIVMGW